MIDEETSRDATYEERATWGTCQCCGAKHGEKCDPNKGWPFGMTVNGLPAQNGAHFGRLQAAPRRVALVRAG